MQLIHKSFRQKLENLKQDAVSLLTGYVKQQGGWCIPKLKFVVSYETNDMENTVFVEGMWLNEKGDLMFSYACTGAIREQLSNSAIDFPYDVLFNLVINLNLQD